MKLTETARKTIFGMLLVLGLLLPVLMNVSKADNGPKPSITINVKNGPAAGFIALLEEGSNRENSFAEREEARMKEKYPDEREQPRREGTSGDRQDIQLGNSYHPGRNQLL